MEPASAWRGVRAVAVALALAAAGPAAAAAVEASVVDRDGEPFEGAVLMVFTGTGRTPDGPGIVDVDQKEKEFVPRISAVSVGTKIRFPNYDQIRHHVYSFSPAKSFEIPLYKGIPADPIVFDKAGVVTLGCNIHDWMQGWVLVTDAERFAQAGADGVVRIEGLPAGSVRLRVWHPETKSEPEATERTLEIAAEGAETVRFEVEREKTWRARRRGGGRDRY